MTFSEGETRGRRVWFGEVSASVLNILFTEDQFCPVDGHLTGKTGMRAVFELKSRDIPSDLYTTYILELRKYKALMKEAIESGYTPLYVCIFQDKLMICDVSKLDITDRVTVMNCTHTTVNYNKGQTPKEVILIKPEECLWRRRKL